jgi:formylglycine-generating enzyme required for sulfatase activity
MDLKTIILSIMKKSALSFGIVLFMVAVIAVAEETPPPQPGDTIVVNIPHLAAGAKPLEMVYIPAGSFQMGSPESEIHRELDESPQHHVSISQPFYLGKYEVTQAQWLAVMGSNPYYDYGVGNDYPVYYVSWYDCLTFINRLNGMGLGFFRLPTEAEWEYACRAGTSTRFFWGDDPDYALIGDYAWFDGNNEPFGTKPVGLKSPNPWNLFDMCGNVYEWCYDRYGAYPASAQTDPQGPDYGTIFVYRGGSWSYGMEACRSANRYRHSNEFRFYVLGLRLYKSYP